MNTQELLEDYNKNIDRIFNRCIIRLDNLQKGIEEESYLSSLKRKLIEAGYIKRKGSEVVLEELRNIPKEDREWFNPAHNKRRTH